MEATHGRGHGWPERLTCVCIGAGIAVSAAGVTFTPRYTDAPGTGFLDPALGPQRRQAFEFALNIWRVRIPGAMTVNVDVDATFQPLGGSQFSATLATGGPSAFAAGFPGAASASLAYPSALANYLATSDLNGGQADIDITFNSDIDGPVLGSASWYYGLNAQGPAADVDFVSVALHELTHSLGFISTGLSDGTFGADTPQGTFPDVFDAFLVNGGGARLTDLPPRPSNVTSPVFWGGALGVGQYQRVFGTAGQPPMYSPPIFEPGSSLSHLDQGTFTGPLSLMAPVASQAVHSPDDVVRGIMADIGWQSTGPGDVDIDGVVGILDVFSLINGLGAGFGAANYSMALDVDLNGLIDQADLAALAGRFGQFELLGTAPAAAAALAGAMTTLPGSRSSLVYQAVPEPLAGMLLLAGVLAAGGRLRPRAD